jgi:hypothetical protein
MASSCVCMKCGRIGDCGLEENLCEICLSDRSALSRIAIEEVVLDVDKAQPFVVISGDHIAREANCKGWENAVKLLEPTASERLALVIDIPRESDNAI